MASAISAISSQNAAASASAASSTGLGSAAPSEEVFLQLLVAQIKNQDPLNPTDSTQFVSQLAQFSELEQVVGIRQDIESGMSAGGASSTNNSSSSSSGNPTNSSTDPANSAS